MSRRVRQPSRRLRRLARSLLADPAEDEAAEGARRVLQRTGPDRVAIVLAALCVLFLLSAVALYVGR